MWFQKGWHDMHLNIYKLSCRIRFVLMDHNILQILQIIYNCDALNCTWLKRERMNKIG